MKGWLCAGLFCLQQTSRKGECDVADGKEDMGRLENN